MDNEKLDALLGWCFDTVQRREETYAAALKAGIDVGDAMEFFNPTIFMEALAGHELKVGYYDFEGDTKGEFLLWAKDAIGTEPETEPA